MEKATSVKSNCEPHHTAPAAGGCRDGLARRLRTTALSCMNSSVISDVHSMPRCRDARPKLFRVLPSAEMATRIVVSLNLLCRCLVRFVGRSEEA